MIRLGNHSTTEIANALGVKTSSVRMQLTRLVNSGKLVKNYGKTENGRRYSIYHLGQCGEKMGCDNKSIQTSSPSNRSNIGNKQKANLTDQEGNGNRPNYNPNKSNISDDNHIQSCFTVGKVGNKGSNGSNNNQNSNNPSIMESTSSFLLCSDDIARGIRHLLDIFFEGRFSSPNTGIRNWFKERVTDRKEILEMIERIEEYIEGD